MGELTELVEGLQSKLLKALNNSVEIKKQMVKLQKDYGGLQDELIAQLEDNLKLREMIKKHEGE